MDGTEGNAGQPGPAERSHRSSVSSVGARAADVLVYLADDTVVPLAVENLPSLNAHELHRAVREVLQLPDIALDVFALWLVSPLLGKPFLEGRGRCHWVWQRRRQMGVLRLLYEEAKGNVLAARYPCDVEDCEALGALVCRVQLGPYQPGQPTACAVRGGPVGPGAGARGGEGRPGEGDPGRSVPGAGGDRLMAVPLPRCAFFHGEVDKPAQGFLHRGGRKPVVVAISLEGVHVIDSREKHVLLGLRFQELSWDHTSPEEEESVLWLEFDGDHEGTPVNRLLKIYSKQAELMSGLIEYCIELNQTSELAAPQETVSGPPSAASSLPSSAQRPQLQRQGSVVCSRLQHLSTIDYVEEGEHIKRVKPKRTTSFFSRQLSVGQGSYTVVQPADSLEQG
uniref:FERM domain containing 8 n=1 Tax=Panthera tigris altaica TaxID=74533 RepID=A0A8C9M6Z1_PANTA